MAVGRGVERVQAFFWGDPSRRGTAEWANELAELAVSVARPNSWDRHMEWFRARLVDPQSILYTAVNGQSHPIGMVRYQLDGSHAILSINVTADFTLALCSCDSVAGGGMFAAIWQSQSK
jgi:hypothetical protein